MHMQLGRRGKGGKGGKGEKRRLLLYDVKHRALRVLGLEHRRARDGRPLSDDALAGVRGRLLRQGRLVDGAALVVLARECAANMYATDAEVLGGVDGSRRQPVVVVVVVVVHNLVVVALLVTHGRLPVRLPAAPDMILRLTAPAARLVQKDLVHAS